MPEWSPEFTAHCAPIDAAVGGKRRVSFECAGQKKHLKGYGAAVRLRRRAEGRGQRSRERGGEEKHTGGVLHGAFHGTPCGTGPGGRCRVYG